MMMTAPDTLSIYCYDWSKEESYGRVAHELANHLEQGGMYVNRIGNNSPQQKPVRLSLGGIALGYPTMISNYGKLLGVGPVVWLTMFESTRLPFLWSDILNTTQHVIVPATFQETIFRQSGVTVPMSTVPLGVSEQFQYTRRTRKPGEPYTFLSFADRGRRKGWEYAGFAFMRAFGDNPNYRLILKGRKENQFPVVANPNIQMLKADMTDEQLAALYEQCDCMIFPGREGFGLPPREFAATGGTSIALNWGGTADDLSMWGLPIAPAGMEAAWKGHERLEGLGEWAAVDVDDLAQTMKHVAANREYYRERGQQQSAYVRMKYKWATFAEQVRDIWMEACTTYDQRTLPRAV